MLRTLKLLLAAIALLVVQAGPAQAAKFASMHNHPDLDWFTIETEHFFVHYPVSKKSAEEGNEHFLTGEWSARITARIAEEMWQPMCAEFNYYLKEKVHIVILNHADYLEGFTIPSWDWIEVSANPGSYFYRMRGRMEWFSDVMVHEFAHVVSLKANSPMAEGSFATLVGGLYSNGITDTDTGAEFLIGDTDPFYWAEGGAEYWSDNTGYNWWSNSRDMNIRTTVLEDRLLTFDEWRTRAEKRDWGDGERGYQQGYSFANYMRERFGDEVFGRFALEYGKQWRADWEHVMEIVTGVPPEQLYDDWVAFLTERYEAVWAEVKADGEVEGTDMGLSGPAEWRPGDPDARDAWLEKPKRDREDAIEGTGTWMVTPKFSADGRWYGVHNRGVLSIQKGSEASSYALSGVTSDDPELAETLARMSWRYPADFMHGWDFVPGQDAAVITGNEHDYGSRAQAAGLWTDRDGYDWKQLWYVPFSVREDSKRGQTWETLEPREVLGSHVYDDVFPIPNTLRGFDPAMSPDGERVAFFEYTDGTLNLATIRLDGTDKQYLTDFTDGAWMQQASWSRDGQQIVFTLMRNFQQNLWIVGADGSGLRPITWDAHEEMDATWGWDGRLYFSADPTGIFNIFRYDPETGGVDQLTNVIGGAQAPSLTPNGNLVYTNFTAHGWKTYGLRSTEFLGRDATDLFQLDIPEAEVADWLGYVEDLSEYAAVTTPYRPMKSLAAPAGIPLLLFSNDSLNNWGIQGGAQVFAQDVEEDHSGFVQVLLGEDIDLIGGYTNTSWYPDFFFQLRHIRVKYDFTYSLDEDGDFSTEDDRTLFQGKNAQAMNVAVGGMSYPLNRNLDAGVFAVLYSYAFRTTSDPAFVPFAWRASVGPNLVWSNVSTRNAANPRGGRVVELDYSLGYTDVVYSPYYGVDVDDGEELDKYFFNTFQARWTEHIAVPDLFSKALGREQRDHTVTVDAQVGVIDRNVSFNDEFRLGGRHPYFWGSGIAQPNTMFAGYPSSSLSGETMAMLSLAYRFPVWTKINKKVGPLYIYDIYAQVMGTAGNVWSYRPPENPNAYYTNRYDARVAYDPSQIKREIPFANYAYKNSPVDPQTGEISKNYLLYDAGVELRVASVMFNSFGWNSFLRLAYGFNEIRGVGDVNGDDIIDTSDSTLGDSLSNETEPAGLRVYVGLGTGW